MANGITIYEEDWYKYKMLVNYLKEKYGNRVNNKTAFSYIIDEALKNKEQIKL